MSEKTIKAQTEIEVAIQAGRDLARIQQVGDCPVAFLRRAQSATQANGLPGPTGAVSDVIESLEMYLPAPLRTRGEAKLATPMAFVGYVKRFSDKTRSMVFADRVTNSFTCAIDASTPSVPSWATHRAILPLQFSRQWSTWIGQNGQKKNQSEFAQFLEANILEIAKPDSAHLLMATTAFEASKSVTFSSSSRQSDGSVNFSYVEEVQGAQRPGVIKMPEVVTLVMPVYHGGEPAQIDAKIRFRIGEGGKLSLWYELVRPADVVEAAFDEIGHVIESGVHDVVALMVEGMGAF